MLLKLFTTIFPLFMAVLTAKPAVAGSKFEAVKEVPFTAGDPPVTAAVAVPLAQLDVKFAVDDQGGEKELDDRRGLVF